MKIAFACPSCAQRLSADAALAGRSGRCRHCGHRLVVPTDGRGSGGPRGGAGKAAATGRRGPLPDWREAVASQLKPPSGRGHAAAARTQPKPSSKPDSGYSLRPVTPTAVPAIEMPDWSNAEFGDPIDLPEAVSEPAYAPVATRAAARRTTHAGPYEPSSAMIAYRWIFSRLARITTWISETSYTVSFILIILALAGGMVGRHSLAALATTAIVLLNFVGLAGDLASLVTLSFRRNPVQGTLFLVPPFTLYYLWSDWDRYRDTVGRMRIPLVTLAFVVVAYLCVPWLRGGNDGQGPLVAAVERTVGTVQEDLGRPKGAIEEWLKKSRSWLHDVPLPDPSALPGSRGTGHPATGHGHRP